ncbi:BTB/POZ domain-containing protein KCTD19 [Manis javanica]|nr:BTB/POZ domain-containing protein KCTD19 [Manis javanica]
MQTAGRIFGDVDTAMPLVKQLAYKQANKWCREAIRPWKNKDLSTYIKQPDVLQSFLKLNIDLDEAFLYLLSVGAMRKDIVHERGSVRLELEFKRFYKTNLCSCLDDDSDGLFWEDGLHIQEHSKTESKFCLDKSKQDNEQLAKIQPPMAGLLAAFHCPPGL